MRKLVVIGFVMAGAAIGLLSALGETWARQSVHDRFLAALSAQSLARPCPESVKVAAQRLVGTTPSAGSVPPPKTSWTTTGATRGIHSS
jgi:hypothetical protein